MVRTVVSFIIAVVTTLQSYIAPFDAGFSPLPTNPVAVASSTPAATAADTETAVRDTVLPQADVVNLTSRLKLNGASFPTTSTAPASDRAVGSRETFWMTDITSRRYYTITATLVAKSEHAYMYVADNYKVNTADLQRSLQTFEEKIYPTNRKYFGSEWTPGVDNDPRITILNTLINGAGGYFSQADEFPAQVNPYTNMREIIYIATPPGNEYYDGTIAHEFQHMIEFHENPSQSVWLNEGSSELAMWLNNYGVGGTDSYFLLNPDTQLNAWGSDPNLSISHYGAAYVFLRYLSKLYGPEFIRDIVQSKQPGIRSVEAALQQRGIQRDFNSLFKDWVVANWLNGRNTNDPRYGYGDKGLISINRTTKIQTYPNSQRATVQQYAADYYELTGSGTVTVNFSGTRNVAVIGNQPHSGAREWWSNRDDGIDSTLTRSFDLSNVSGTISMNFWAWYDIENGFDYAYVTASDDGGKTWKTLPTANTTDYNPYGNNYGVGYTGVSRAGTNADATQAMWLEERVDLSGYAGKQVQIRFELITDGAYNAQGLAIDDISIPAIGYRDDAESGDGGWQANGWLRTDNIMPQRYYVQVVKVMADGSYNVADLPIATNGKGSLTINDLGSNVQSATLIVAAYAPKTTQAATYNLDIVKK